LLSGYQRDTLSATDTANLVALAYKCSLVDGPAVYKARALYMDVFDELPIFTDAACDGDAGYTPKAEHPATAIARQAYKLYPNPTDGHITLVQGIADNEPVSTEIWGATGNVVYKDKLHFDGGNAKLVLDKLAPGLLDLIQMIDSKGERFVIKFTIQ
jgi:hypothetical protein